MEIINTDAKFVDYMRGLPNPGTPEYESVLVETGARAVEAMESRLANDKASRQLIIRDKGQVTGDSCIYYRGTSEPVSMSADPSPQPYRYTRLRAGGGGYDLLITPGEVPKILKDDPRTRQQRFVPVEDAFLLERVIADVVEGEPYDHRSQMVVGNKIVSKRSMSGLGARALKFFR